MYVYFLKIFPLTVRVHFTTVFLFHYFSKLCSSDLSRYFLNLNFYLIKYVKNYRMQVSIQCTVNKYRKGEGLRASGGHTGLCSYYLLSA